MIDSVSDTAGGGAPDLKRGRRQKPPTLGQRGAAALDRLPPHSPDMEQGVLGCILLSPNDSAVECVEKLKDNGHLAFYDLRHQTIYQAIMAMFAVRAPIDLITVQQWLKDRQLLEQIGGIAYLSQLQDCVPSAANLTYYLEKVIEKYTLRRLINTCAGVSSRVFEHEGDVDALLDEVEKEIHAVSDDRNSTGSVPIKQLLGASMDQIEAYFTQNGQISGISTGLADLDRLTDGLQNTDLIVIAARPSMGKTSLGMGIAEHVALEAKLPVGVFSLEMSGKQLCTRMVCSIARVNIRAIRDGLMSENDFPKLQHASERLNAAKLFIDDTPGLSILQLRARARRMHQQHGIKLFVVDYLQLLHSTSRKAQENRQQEIAEISSGLKSLAKELNVPVIVLAQLNREIEKTPGRKPRMSDLRESGSIEQDADIIGLLYRLENEDEPSTQAEADAGIPVNLLIAKQRNGPTGDCELTFLKDYTRFEQRSHMSDNDVPQ